MPTCQAAQYSEWTREKHEQLGGLFQMYVPILRSLSQSRRLRRFIYLDLYAGPGRYDHGANGSPLLAAHAFHEEPWCEAMHCFEEDWDTYCRLTASTAAYDKVIAHHARNQDGIDFDIVRSINRDSYGICFSDPNCGHADSAFGPLDVLNTVAARWPRIDIVAYLSAANIKRIRTAFGGPHLIDQVRAIRKPFVRIRKPSGRHQWTFILLTGWEGFPVWKRAGWVNLNSDIGRSYLEELDETWNERRGRRNPSLLDSLDE